MSDKSGSPGHVCPVWLGYFLASPLRKLMENPRRSISEHLARGMCAMDVGCAMGFYSIPMAEMVGEEGKVICIDLQEKMVRSLLKRARKRQLADRMELRVCTRQDLNIADVEDSVDFALASAVVHEVPDPSHLFSQLHRAMQAGAKLLVIEPAGHVSKAGFERTISAAEKEGFELLERNLGVRRHRALFVNSVRNGSGGKG